MAATKQRARLQGARTPGPDPLLDQRPTRVQRTVSCAAAPKSSANASKSGCVTPARPVTIDVDETTLRIYDQRGHMIKPVPRTSRKEVTRPKAYGHTINRKIG